MASHRDDSLVLLRTFSLGKADVKSYDEKYVIGDVEVSTFAKMTDATSATFLLVSYGIRRAYCRWQRYLIRLSNLPSSFVPLEFWSEFALWRGKESSIMLRINRVRELRSSTFTNIGKSLYVLSIVLTVRESEPISS